MERKISLADKSFTLFLNEQKIQEAIGKIAEQITQDYQGKNPLFVPILNGSFMFAADLLKRINVECEVTFTKVASYAGTTSTGELRSLIGLGDSLKDRHVVILEDIVDSGHTLSRLIPEFLSQQPASLKIATLLFKPDALKVELKLDYIGMAIPNEFIVGYGLDYNGLGRNLPDIYQVIP